MKKTLILLMLFIIIALFSFKPQQNKSIGVLIVGKTTYTSGDTVLITKQGVVLRMIKYHGNNDFNYYGQLYIVK